MEHRVFIGTGLIGAGMVEAALKRGEKVRVWNRTRAKAERLGELGAVVADTLAEDPANSRRPNDGVAVGDHRGDAVRRRLLYDFAAKFGFFYC